MYARTSVTRVDPVYLAEVPGAVIVADRATWAAWTSSRLDDHDPLHLCALLNPGFPLGSVTPFSGRDRRRPGRRRCGCWTARRRAGLPRGRAASLGQDGRAG